MGKSIAHYSITGKLGQGGLAAVFHTAHLSPCLFLYSSIHLLLTSVTGAG